MPMRLRTIRFNVILLCLLPCLTIAAFAQSGDSGQVGTLIRQGAQAMHAGDAAAAEGFFRKATVADPEAAPAWLDMGLAELKQGKVADAMGHIRKALQLDPNAPGAHLFLGIAEYQTSHPDEAIADLAPRARHRIASEAKASNINSFCGPPTANRTFVIDIWKCTLLMQHMLR